MTDLTYIDGGMFTTFVAETKAGEVAWNEAAKKLGGNFKIFTVHLKSTLQQLKQAGYKVSKAKKPSKKLNDIFEDELLANLI